MESSAAIQRLSIVDSHTGGEPTRVVVSGGPALGRGSLHERLRVLREQYDWLRRQVILEPRGSEVIVGALLCEPVDAAHAGAVIFFNDVGYLGMCGHGTIGLVTTLAHLGRIQPGVHAIETPVGMVQTELNADGTVSIQNVFSYRHRAAIEIEVPGLGRVVGDVAWGGNWFFLVDDAPYPLLIAHRAELVAAASAIRAALAVNGITGKDGAHIDHIEFCAAPEDTKNSGRNFVLCPGASFDRSPCGTGTSAKMACLHASGKLQPGENWRQEGILGTVFTGSIAVTDHPEVVVPTITGHAWITAESTFLFDPTDPFRDGIVL